MNTTFHRMSIQHIQAEEQGGLAEVEVQFIEDKILIDTTLLLSFKDLNALFLKLSRHGLNLSLSEDFDSFSTEEGRLFMLDFTAKGWDKIEIESFVPSFGYRQIRA